MPSEDERRITIGQEEECLCQQKAGTAPLGVSFLAQALGTGKTKIMEIFADIYQERLRQESAWGSAFDDKNTINDWVTYICQYTTVAAGLRLTPQDSRIALLKAASIIVAALEASYRNEGFPPRHYENHACNDPNAGRLPNDNSEGETGG